MRYPTEEAMMKSMRICLEKDKPINMSFWMDSLKKTLCMLYTRENEFILSKSDNINEADEYSSSIVNRYTVGEDLICETENSLYIVDARLPEKKERV
jgi:hypothetical protein